MSSGRVLRDVCSRLEPQLTIQPLFTELQTAQSTNAKHEVELNFDRTAIWRAAFTCVRSTRHDAVFVQQAPLFHHAVVITEE